MFSWNSLNFFDNPTDVGHLISGSSAFSKTSLNIWNFMPHVLLKPGLEKFEHYFTSMWDECNYSVVWVYLALPFFVIGMKTDLFQSCGHCWVFQISWCIECSTFSASSFRIWNSSDRIPSPPLALFIVMLLNAHLTSHSRMFGSRWVIIPLWLSGLYTSSVYSCHFFLISCASVRIWPNGYYTRDGIKELRSIGDSYGDDGPLSLNLKRREVKKKEGWWIGNNEESINLVEKSPKGSKNYCTNSNLTSTLEWYKIIERK